jgi:hypothetical protein
MARRAKKALYLSNGGQLASIEGLEKALQRAASVPDAVVARVAPVARKIGQEIVDGARAIAPVSELTKDPGAFRDSIHLEDGLTELSVKVVSDVRDEKDQIVAKHIEHGHKAADGSHVAAVPTIWPVVRVKLKSMRSRMNRAVNLGCKEAMAGDAS